MSQEHVLALRTVYSRWERGDLTASLSLLDEDVTLAVDPDIPDGGTYRGTDGVRDYMSRFLEPWDSLRIAAESYTDAGDAVLVKVRQTGTGKTSGVPVELRYFQLWSFDDGRVTRIDVIMSEERALQAADLTG